MLPPDDPLSLLEKQVIPPADATRKADAILKANIAFREKSMARAQGRSWLARLLGRSTPAKEPVMARYTFAKRTAVAVVALVAVATSLDYVRSSVRHTSAPVSGHASYAKVSQLATDSAPATRSSSGQIPDSIDNVSGNFSPIPDVVGSLSAKPIIDSIVGASKDSAPASQPYAAAPSSPTYQPTPSYQNIQPLAEYETSGADARLQAHERFRRFEQGVPPFAPGVPPDFMPHSPAENRDNFANTADNPLQEVAQSPVSTFSADTDTASYSVARRLIEAGQLPPPEAIRTEEFINYFNYNYAAATDKAQPFAPTVSVFANPWNTQTQLMHIGIKAYDLPADVRPPVNLVLLIDVSGSMGSSDKLELAKRSFALMLDKLQPSDTISIVTYAGNSGVALQPTSLEHKERILSVINSLQSGGSTAGAAGLATAYDLAKQNFRKEGVNRILLATDGDFNVGVSAPGGIAEYVAQQRSSGVFLSVLGFGMGNYQDTTMQAVAQNGNGVAAYIDSIGEARRVLSDQIGSTMFTVAKDVKFQVEFNPAAIKGYRLLGYETRALRREDFDNDKVDAGEVGAGHEVTAIYELVPVGATMPADATLRYQAPAPAAESTMTAAEPASELAFLRIRYKLPESDTSTLIERPVTRSDIKDSVSETSTDVRFATAVAGFSRLLRHSTGMSNFSYADVIALAQGARGEDPSGERTQFIELVKNTQALAGAQPRSPEEGGVAFPPPQ